MSTALGLGLERPAEARESAAETIVIRSSTWEPGTVGSWSAFTVEVTNEGAEAFRGELVLAPVPSVRVAIPAPPSGASHLERATPSDYRTPVDLDPGVAHTVSIVVVVTGNLYAPEVQDRRGHVVARGEPRMAGPMPRDQLGLLTDVPHAHRSLAAGRNVHFDVSPRFTSARDFPHDAVFLSGLKAVVIASFDSTTLAPNQLKALRDFVALGGSLVVGGGNQWERTVRPLPEDLTPLRPTTTAVASLAPLADLAAQSDDQIVAIAVGPVQAGRAVLKDHNGLPLVVEAAYGAGRIVQVAYDPFEHLRTPGLASLIAQDHAFLRAGVGVAQATLGTPPFPTLHPSIQAWAVFDAVPAPSLRPGWAATALVAYGLIAGPLLHGMLRSRRRAVLMWLALPALALVAAGAVGFTRMRGLWRESQAVDQVQIQRTAGDGTVAIDAYHRLSPTREGHAELRFEPGTLSWVNSAGRLGPSPAIPGLDFLARPGPPSRTAAEQSRGVIRVGEAARAEFYRWAAWDTKWLMTSSVSTRPVAVTAHLRLEAGKVVGTITNTSGEPILELGLQSAGGMRAAVARYLGPGKSVDVRVSILPSQRRTAPLAAAERREGTARAAAQALLRAAADSAALEPGELVIVGMVPAEHHVRVDGPLPRGNTLAAMAVTVRLAAADALAAGLGLPRLVCACGPIGGERYVHEMEVPAGVAGPFVVEFTAIAEPGRVEIYNWASNTWRTIRDRTKRHPVLPDEVGEGLVRVRTQGQIFIKGLTVAAP